MACALILSDYYLSQQTNSRVSQMFYQ